MTRRIVPLLLTLAISLVMPACSSTAPPESTFPIYEPTAAPQARAAVILINFALSSDDEVIIQRLNNMLELNGQRVSFKARSMKDLGSGEGAPFLRRARQELEAGQPAADAYAMLPDDSLAFFSDSLTMDVTELVQKNAPIYYNKYADIFDKTLSGIPIGVDARPIWSKTALMLRKDYLPEGGGITTLDGLFRFLDESVAAQAGAAAVLANPLVLVNQWALESGYYRLDMYGVDGYLYAALGDPKCTPVPLESIPGLDVFLGTMMRHYAEGTLNSSFSADSSGEPIGFVKDLGDYFYHYPYQWLSWIPGEFAVQPLSPEAPSSFYGPFYTAELAIPASCPQEVAAEVARFVEWYNLSQENHDVIVYGQQGVDFSVTGTRFTPLKNGETVAAGQSQGQGLFFQWTGAMLFSNTEFFRLPSGAPAGVEQMYDGALKSARRTEASGRLKYRETVAAARGLSAEMQGVRAARNDALSALINAAPTSYTDNNYTQVKDALAKVRTDMLVSEYQRIIGSLMEK